MNQWHSLRNFRRKKMHKWRPKTKLAMARSPRQKVKQEREKQSHKKKTLKMQIKLRRKESLSPNMLRQIWLSN